MLDRVKTFVTKSFGKENLHLTRTLFWIRELKPDAGEELLIAAVSHDIERAFNPEAKEMTKYRSGKEQEYHQTEGVRIMFDFLVDNGYDAVSAARVRELISRHEVGGDEEQNILMDADSISWLEVSAPKHISKEAVFEGRVGEENRFYVQKDIFFRDERDCPTVLQGGNGTFGKGQKINLWGRRLMDNLAVSLFFTHFIFRRDAFLLVLLA